MKMNYILQYSFEECPFEVGMTVEKYEGEAIWVGELVSVYRTSKGKIRCVVDVQPQGFQMITTPKLLRLYKHKS